MWFELGLQLDEPSIMLRWGMSPYELARMLGIKSFRSVAFPAIPARALGNRPLRVRPSFSASRNLDRILIDCPSIDLSTLLAFLEGDLGRADETRKEPWEAGYASEVIRWIRSNVFIDLALIDAPGGPYPLIALRRQ